MISIIYSPESLILLFSWKEYAYKLDRTPWQKLEYG